jgi:hypothetical protein
MVAGGGLSADPDFGHLFLETLALRGASVEQSALVAQAGARIDLASLLPALRQVGLIGRRGWQDLRYAQGKATTSSQSLSWLAGFVFRPTARASLAIGYEAEPTLGGNKGKDLAEAFLRFGVAFP